MSPPRDRRRVYALSHSAHLSRSWAERLWPAAVTERNCASLQRHSEECRGHRHRIRRCLPVKHPHDPAPFRGCWSCSREGTVAVVANRSAQETAFDERPDPASDWDEVNETPPPGLVVVMQALHEDDDGRVRDRQDHKVRDDTQGCRSRRPTETKVQARRYEHDAEGGQEQPMLILSPSHPPLGR